MGVACEKEFTITVNGADFQANIQAHWISQFTVANFPTFADAHWITGGDMVPAPGKLPWFAHDVWFTSFAGNPYDGAFTGFVQLQKVLGVWTLKTYVNFLGIEDITIYHVKASGGVLGVYTWDHTDVTGGGPPPPTRDPNYGPVTLIAF